MPLEYVSHETISLLNHPNLNERWLQDRIEENPAILGLGEVRLLDRERPLQGGGRLDLLLIDDDNNRRYEVEIQLGATNPSHIIRCIEYWDLERRRYPGYDHVAVLVAENITTRFLNVMSLLGGSIPMIAIQLDALKVENRLLLNFTQVLDQTELRTDDTDPDSGGGQTDRAYWEQRAGSSLMQLCDSLLEMIQQSGTIQQEFNYLRSYIGLKSHGVVNNFIHIRPRPTRNFVHVHIRNANATMWSEKFEECGIPARVRQRGRFRLTITPQEFAAHQDLIREVVQETVEEFES